MLREFSMRWDEKEGSLGELLWDVTVHQDATKVLVLTMGRVEHETMQEAMRRLAPFLRRMSECMANPYVIPSD
jgi:hypothetical protein